MTNIVKVVKGLLVAGVLILLYVLGGFLFFLAKLAVIALVGYYVYRKKDAIVQLYYKYKKLLDDAIDNH